VVVMQGGGVMLYARDDFVVTLEFGDMSVDVSKCGKVWMSSFYNA
jgi:hypothetical protein